MAMRRPRIKPVANILLNSKRKTKSATNDKSNLVAENDAIDVQNAEKINSAPTKDEKVVGSDENTVMVIAGSSVDTTANKNNTEGNENLGLGAIVQEFENNAKVNIQNISGNHQHVAIEKDLINDTEEQVLENHYDGIMSTVNDSDAFKCPPKIGFQRTVSNVSNSGIDDVFYSDIEENALQMDYESSPSNSCPMSPSKNFARQRIRPTPHFGQRRNSFVGSSPSPHTSANDENHTSSNSATTDVVQTSQTRRERHHSASYIANSNISTSVHNNHLSHKYLPSGVISTGRTRTESGCSVLSDTSTSTQKLRRKEDHKRKDFESRCYQKVPDKNALKMNMLTYSNTAQSTPDKNALRMCDLIYYNPATNPMEQKRNPSEKVQVAEESLPKDTKPFAEKVEQDTESDAVPVPQLKLNAKGELILDDTSLVIETTAEQEARKVLANSSLIYLDECTGMNGFYTRRKGTRKWLPSETIKFYRCLQNVGTDFSLMVALFPNRTRRDLKLKFKKEERKNGHLINKAIVYPKLFDIESLKQELDEEQERLGPAEAEIDKKKSKKKKKVNTSSKANRVLLHGNGLYQDEPDLNSKRYRKSDMKKDKTDKIVHKENEDAEAQKDPAEIEKATCNKTKPKSKYRRKKGNVPKLIENENIPNNESINADNIILDTVETNYVDRDERNWTPSKVPKEEIIKTENKQESNQTSASNEYQDTKQLQTEIDELLGSDALDVQYDNTSYKANVPEFQEPTEVAFNDTSQDEQYNEEINEVLHKALEEDYDESEADIDKYEHTSFINLDDGSVDVYSNIKDNIVFINSSVIVPPPQPSRSQSAQSLTESVAGPIENVTQNNSLKSTTPELDVNNDTCSSVTSERELSEADIQSILRELAEGTLVLVSTLDPDDPDKVLNEIYMVDKNTGDLCDEPLGIPDSIVQCILTVVS